MPVRNSVSNGHTCDVSLTHGGSRATFAGTNRRRLLLCGTQCLAEVIELDHVFAGDLLEYTLRYLA